MVAMTTGPFMKALQAWMFCWPFRDFFFLLSLKDRTSLVCCTVPLERVTGKSWRIILHVCCSLFGFVFLMALEHPLTSGNIYEAPKKISSTRQKSSLRTLYSWSCRNRCCLNLRCAAWQAQSARTAGAFSYIRLDPVDVCVTLRSVIPLLLCRNVHFAHTSSISHRYPRYKRQKSVNMSMQPIHLFIKLGCNEFTNIRWLEGGEPVG